MFNGVEGTANWPSGSTGTRLTIEKFDGQSIVIRRFDRTGATAGLSGVYNGVIQNNRIEGTAKWSWDGHPGFPRTGAWAAIIQNTSGTDGQTSSGAPTPSSTGIPPRLLECEGVGVCSGAWTISGSEGSATWFSHTPTRAKLTIVRSAPGDILIRRTNTSDGVTAVYTGTQRGNQLSGTVIWSNPGNPSGSSGTWSASVPQTSCDKEANPASADAMRIGQNALMFGLEHDAFDCYIMAAKTGDRLAQTVVGLIYYQGRESSIPQDYGQALFWLRKAADQGSYAAQRTLVDMYRLGQGTTPDPGLSQIYAQKADEQKHDFERRQDRADRTAAMLTGFVMGAVFGAFLF
jgi:hypothetical protein